MKVYFVRATILILATISTINAADDPCPNSYDQTTPISGQRSSGTMSINYLLCEQSDADLTVEHFQSYEKLGLRVRDNFCSHFNTPTNTQSNSGGVCNSKNQYNFTEFGEHFSTFVSNLSTDLNALIPKIPASFENSEYSSEEVKALMYLCTHYHLEKNKKILKQAASEAEKERAIENLARLNLLTHFFETDEGFDFLANPDLSKSLRMKAFKKYLESSHTNKELVLDMLDYVRDNLEENSSKSPDELQDYQKVELEMSRVAMEAMNDYLQAPSNEQSPIVLDLLVQAEIQGAQEALNRLQEKVTTNYPKCEEISLDDFDERSFRQSYNRISNAILEMGRENSPFNSPPQDKWKWYQNFFALENNPDWFQLELKMKQGPYGDNDLKTLSQHYCFYQKLEGDIELFQSLDGDNEVASSLANKIFDQINELGAGNQFLSLIKELYPHLSEENKKDAIDSIKYAKSSLIDDQQLNQWRLNTLKDWFIPHSDDYSSPLAREIISAISFKGSIEEEKLLSELFQKAKSPEDKGIILNQYSFNTLLEDTNGKPEILNAIAQESNEELRNQYIVSLGAALSRVGVYGASKGGFATDQIGKVSLDRMRGTLKEMIALSTNQEVNESLYKQIYRRIEEVDGVISDVPANNDNLPITKPVNYKGELKPINSDGSLAGSKPQYYNSKEPLEFGSKPPKKDLRPLYGNNVDYQQVKAKQLKAANEQRDFADSRNVFDDNQNSFLNSMNKALGLAPSGNALDTAPPLAPVVASNPVVGEKITNNPLNDSFGAGLARTSSSQSRFGSNNSTEDIPSANNDSESTTSSRRRRKSRNNNQDIINEIRQISRDTSNLRREIDDLNGPTAPLYPAANQVASASEDYSPQQGSPQQQARGTSGPSNSQGFPSRNIASSGQSSAPQRGDSFSSNDQAVTAPEKGANPFSQGLLAPFDDPSKNDLDKVIKITSEEEKILLMNYMAANEEMSCPELRFIKQFYDENVNKFMMSNARREYALLELDGINFRFNYPGTGSLRVKIQETCATLAGKEGSKTVGQGGRAPASVSSEIVEESSEQKELVPTEVKPANGPKALMKKFMLKLGL